MSLQEDLTDSKTENTIPGTSLVNNERTSAEEGHVAHIHTRSGVLKKDLGWLGILSAAYNVSNSWLVVAATMVISIGYGPMNTIWGIIVILPIYTGVGLSLAELVSVYPTVGGQYHWTSILAPPKVRNMMNWQTFLIYQAVVVLSFLFNVIGKTIMKHYYSFGFILSLIAFVVFTVTILAMQGNKQPSEVVWTAYTEMSGWSAGVQFLIVLSAPAVAFCPIDGAVHLVEEVKNATKIVPLTMMISLIISFVTSLAFTLACLYCVVDFDALFITPSHFPLYEIWAQATATTVVPLVFTIVTMLLLPVGSVACFQVSSMLTMSLGRDECLFFSRYVARVNSKLNTPVWAAVMNWAILTLMGCLFLFSTFVGAAVILQQISVFCPIILLIWHRRSEKVLPSSRNFRLPNWLGWTVNLVCIAWTAITSTFFMFPSAMTVEESTMNYAVVVSVGSLAIGLINYFVYAKKRYSGPTLIDFHY
ncbi:hypothetical protein FALCPG4_008653 [Fusarium falciforme]